MTTQEQPRGVPPPGQLGASKKELWALLLAAVVIVAIFAAFWLEARP
jgi:uncharacterized RDD family membrane protein YckC